MAIEKALRADARRNREAIIAAARSVFDGGERLRFDDFAARAGVGVGTLYRHFPTREALAVAVYEEEVARLCEQARDPSRPASERLDAFLHTFVEYVIQHAGLARALAASVDPMTQAAGGNELECLVADLMTEAIVDGTVRTDASPGVVMMMLHGVTSSIDRPSWASEAQEVANYIIRGLTPDAGRGFALEDS